MATKPKMGLLVTALLEDDYNKTGHVRPNWVEVVETTPLSPGGPTLRHGFRDGHLAAAVRRCRHG